MHEFAIASSIVEALLDLANKQGSTKVLEVHLKLGQLRALSVEQVSFSYDVLVKGTLLEGSRLIVEESLGRVRCNQCGESGEMKPDGDAFHFGVPFLICQRCGATMTIEGGDECVITSVRMILPIGKETIAQGAS